MIRQSHRYLGLFIGIQFLFWTVSGLDFSWTDIDEIHGDHFKNLNYQLPKFKNLISPTEVKTSEGINSIELREINGKPYYWINNQKLYYAETGFKKKYISENEAISVAKKYIKDDLKVAGIVKIFEADMQNQYREKLLPAYVI